MPMTLSNSMPLPTRPRPGARPAVSRPNPPTHATASRPVNANPPPDRPNRVRLNPNPAVTLPVRELKRLEVGVALCGFEQLRPRERDAGELTWNEQPTDERRLRVSPHLAVDTDELAVGRSTESALDGVSSVLDYRKGIDRVTGERDEPATETPYEVEIKPAD